LSRYISFKKVILSFLIVVSITACGYKPSAKFSRDVLGEKISTSVIISAQDPENTVIIKDAVDRAIIEVFKASLVTKRASDTHLILNMKTPFYTPIVYDENGFVIAYRMKVILNILSNKNGIEKHYSVTGHNDFTVAPNAIVTDTQRFQAIEFSATRAIRSFIAQVSADGARAGK